jgi:ABC-2 type transport system permease protein
MDKILTIAQKELYTTFTDRPRLLLMLGTPLMIAIILSLVFGSGGGDLTISDISVAVVNLDEGASNNVNFGETVASILLSEPILGGQQQICSIVGSDTAVSGQSLDGFLNAERLDSVETARAGVNDGIYAAAVIIPANFSRILSPDMLTLATDSTVETVYVEIYGSGASPISASVVRSITEAIINPMVTGSTTIRASIQVFVGNPSNLTIMTTADTESFADFTCAFSPSLNTISLVQQAMDGIQSRSGFEQVLITLGSAQALFFSISMANASIQSIYTDRQTGVLQRMLSSPTPRIYILGGKLASTVLIVLVQIGILLLALTSVASLNNGSLTWLWGNPLLVLVMLLITALAVSGVAVFIAGITRTQEESQLIGTLIGLGLAILGGSFGFQLGAVSKFSLIWWGVDGLNTLSGGSTDIGLNVLVLAAHGIILFTIGAWLFNRRVTV